MKRVIILVKNNFINDRRVHNTALSMQNNGIKPKIIAVRSYKHMKYEDDGVLEIKRISSFSSIYSRPKLKINAIKSEQIKINKSVQILKKNKFRLTIIGLLNTLFYELGSYFNAIYYKPDYVWANDLNTLYVAFLISKTCRSKLIYDSHEIFTEGLTYHSLSKIQRCFLRKSEKKFIKKADAVVVTTDLRAEFLQNKYSLDKVWTIKNCHRFVTNTYSENLFRKEFQIPVTAMIFLYQGLIHKKRGIFTLVDVISKVSDAVLILMGDGNSKQELFNYIVENKMEHKIFVKDSVPMDSLINYTASADVGFQLLLNSGFNHFSTISNKVFEYIMAEIPIIASDFPELRKLIIGNDIGMVADPVNTSEIIKVVKKMMKDKDKIKEYKENLRKMKTIYSWENEELKITKILNGISK